ncbi:MAG: pitrilysin family protein [Nitrospiraceae bacterium]|nr:pitrilysin family protein [Nitrospiraceae bacterium]
MVFRFSRTSLLGHCLLFILITTLVPSLPFAQAASTPSKVVQPPLKLALSPHIHHFKNGLTLVTVNDPYSPTLTFQIWYRVGSRNEHRGRTGISHFNEHMMFTGTKKFPHGKLDTLINGVGGQLNAFTDYDFTAYFENVAPDKINLPLAIESDRMTHLLLSPDQVERERNIVLEERRNDYDDPTQKLVEQVYATAYAVHPYHNPVIGWERDIKRTTRGDIRNYYRAHYMPNDATIVVVGPIDEQRLISKVEEYFGSIPPGHLAKSRIPAEPRQHRLRMTIVRKPAMLPITMMAFHTPNFRSPDAMSLVVLAQVLSGGRTSLLYQDMIYRHPVAVDAEGSYDPMTADPGLFYFYAQGLPKTSPPILRKRLNAVIRQVRSSLVSPELLDSAKKQILTQFVMNQESAFGMGMMLGMMSADRIPMSYLTDYVRNIQAVSAEDVRRVARKYLRTTNETVGYLFPTGPVSRPSFSRPGRIVR